MNDKTITHEPTDKPQIIREFEFYGGYIRVKISVKNTSDLIIVDTELDVERDDNILHFDRCEPEYPEKKGRIQLGNINPGTDRTVALYLDPLICAKEGTDVNCHVSYKDAHGRSGTVNMEPLKIKVICPIFLTEHEVNIGRLKEFIKELRFHDSRVYMFPKKVELQEIMILCKGIIQLHDVRHIKTFKTVDGNIYESWHYGKTKVTKKDLVIKCTIRKDTESIEIFVSGDDSKDITGLIAEIGRNLTKEFEKLGNVQPVFNIVVRNSILKESNLLSFCDLNGICGGNVVIEDSLVDSTSVASGMKKKDVYIKKEKKSGKKWFFGVIIILVILVAVVGYYVLGGQYGEPPGGDGNTPVVTPEITPPAAAGRSEVTPSVGTAVMASSPPTSVATIKCELCHTDSQAQEPHVNGGKLCLTCHGSQVHSIHIGTGTIDLKCDSCHGFPPKIPTVEKGDGPGHFSVCEQCHVAPPDNLKPSNGNLVTIHLSRRTYCTNCHGMDINQTHGHEPK